MPRRTRPRLELHPMVPVVFVLLVWLVAEAGYVRCLEKQAEGQHLECHSALHLKR